MKQYHRLIFLVLIFSVSILIIKFGGEKIRNPNMPTLATIKNVFNVSAKEDKINPVVDKTFVSEVSSIGDLSETSSTTLKIYSDGLCSNKEFSSRAILAEYLNQNIRIAEINSQRRWPIASITKLISAIVATENIDPDAVITLTEKSLEAEGNIGNFKAGETFKARDLIKAMIMLSSNDIALALSESVGRDNFLALMREKVQEIGMKETDIFEPTGLSTKNQSTPRDISKLMRYLYNYHPEILKITRTTRETIYEINKKTPRTLANINKFAGRKDFIGGKSGYINDSGGNLVSLFNVRGQPVIIVVFGSNDRVEETKQILECI